MKSLYHFPSIFLLSIIPFIQCYLLNIPTAIINVQTVISCGLSIDIYSSFDPARVIICPSVSVDKEKIQLINMNIFVDHNDEMIIHLNPQIRTPPKSFTKLPNNSFIPTSNINQSSIYYLLFSSELTCRFSLINNKTICFYYPLSSDFIHVEYHYDEIMHGSLMLSEKSRTHFYIIFTIIIILIICMCISAVYILSNNRFQLRHLTPLDNIIDSRMAKQEAASKPAPEQIPDGGVNLAAAEHLNVRETYATIGDG